MTSPPDPHAIFILPELLPARRSDLTLLVLADGNRRSAAGGGGYAGGARAVVTVAEHLARRPDVATLVACILSPDNIAKRGDGFFAELYREFVRLGVAVQARGALVGAGVRLGVTGDLGALRGRGGHGVALADAIEAVAAMTSRVERPALRLVLGVGYRADVATELDVDVILRTGMEEPDALRLSALRPHARAVYAASTRLWPEITAGDVDAVIDAARLRAAPGLAGGHAPEAIVELIVAMAAADLGAPLRALVTTRAPSPRLVPALERILAGSPRLSVRYVGDEASPPRRWTAGAPHELWILPGAPSHRTQRGAGCQSVLAPAQTPPLFTLPDWLLVGHAAVHACDASARGLVAGMRAARRFLVTHPPLEGAERAAPVVALPVQDGLLATTSDRDALADRFAGRMLGWASEAGLLPPGTGTRRAALGYALTAFFLHHGLAAPWDPSGAAWEERAELAARYMLLVAAVDEGVFDRVLPGETSAARLERHAASARFLGEALRDDASRGAPPPGPGAPMLAAIAAGWNDLVAHHRGAAHPELLSAFRAALTDLYGASVAERGAAVTSARLAHDLGAGGAAGLAAGRAIDDRCAGALPCVASRTRELRERLAVGPDAASEDELRVLLYLVGAASAMGAGLLFRVAALSAPAASVPPAAIPALAAAATLSDLRFRLANDATGFLSSSRGDHDEKENSCSILVPPDLTGPAREDAVIRALVTSRRLAEWIEEEMEGAVGRLSEAWPWMGLVFRRGVFLGRRVYEIGHYATLSRAEVSGIAAELDALG